MTWSGIFEGQWLPMAEVLHYSRDQILALTLDQFEQACEYVNRRLGNGS